MAEASARGFETVLVAIRELDGSHAAVLRKAAAIMSPRGRIELLHVLTGPVSIAISGVRQPREAVARAMESGAEQARKRLRRLTGTRALASRSVNVHVTWDYPVADAIARRARAIGADLLVAGVQPPQFGGRLLLANTDWELARECPCPVLLVRPSGRYGRAPVLAAVDPFHANDKPARLDSRLLAIAVSVARVLRAEAHVFHAYVPLAALMAPMATQAIAAVPSEKEEAAYERRVRQGFAALASRARIPPARRHLRAGDVPTQLSDVVRRTGAQLVVMGSLSRSGLKRLLIGNTFERVLDRLECDVLVVKPARFASRVPKRRSGVRWTALPLALP